VRQADLRISVLFYQYNDLILIDLLHFGLLASVRTSTCWF